MPADANAPLKSVVLGEIQKAAMPTATALSLTSLTTVDAAGLGQIPWFWQLGTSFNANTFSWMNNVFAYQSGNYVSASGGTLTTALYNLYVATTYKLNATDAATVNAAITANQAVANTLITDWTSTQGAFPSTVGATEQAQLNYVVGQVLTWGAPGLTLQVLRSSTQAQSLLPNAPLGTTQIINDVMTYLANTSSIANLQSAVLDYNNELATVENNIHSPPSSATAGYMLTIDRPGITAVEPQIVISESTAVLQNALYPASGSGTSFSAQFTVTKQQNNSISVNASGGGSIAGDYLDFLFVFTSGSTTYNLFSANGSDTTCDVTITFNGVTTITPTFNSYNISTGTGWWYPAPIQQAANPTPGASGYQFAPQPAYDFGNDGTFGVVGALMVAQPPTITLKFKTSDYSSYQQTFSETTSWNVSFLGIPLSGGSQSTYASQSSYDTSSQTVTITMSPPTTVSSVSQIDLLAYVIGAEITWPGAPA